MSMTDEEVRHMAISLLNSDTERDRQVKIGASTLANGCDYCLACNMLGISRETPQLSRAWGGARTGTALHHYLEERQAQVDTFKQSHPDAMAEQRVLIGTLGTYGDVPGTSDLLLPGEQHLIDWKSSTRKKSAIMRDFLGQTSFGRTHTAVKLSEKQYAEEIAKAEFKVKGYFDQTQLYMRAWNNAGIRVERASLVFINRDGTMWFDNPSQDGYADPKRMWDVWTLSFDYSVDWADAAWDRGLRLWGALDSGVDVREFDSHPLCFPCGLDETRRERPVKEPVFATLAAAA